MLSKNKPGKIRRFGRRVSRKIKHAKSVASDPFLRRVAIIRYTGYIPPRTSKETLQITRQGLKDLKSGAKSGIKKQSGKKVLMLSNVYSKSAGSTLGKVGSTTSQVAKAYAKSKYKDAGRKAERFIWVHGSSIDPNEMAFNVIEEGARISKRGVRQGATKLGRKFFTAMSEPIRKGLANFERSVHSLVRDITDVSTRGKYKFIGDAVIN